MRRVRLLLSMPLWLCLVVVTAAPASAVSPAPPTASPSPTPSGSPSPVPVNAFLTLDVAAGPLSTTITVTGSNFLPGERVPIYWDPPSNKVAARLNADSTGAFTTSVRPYPGDIVGVHRLCATVAPIPCANFTVTAALPASPFPSPIPTPTPSPTPSPTAPVTASASRLPDTAVSAFDLISKPPFVFVPIAGAVLILLAAAYWALVIFLRRPRPVTLPSAAIVHRASRPDYAAGFGAAPEPPSPEPLPSAWADIVPAAPPAPPPADPPAAPAAEPEPPGGPSPTGGAGA